MIDFIETHREAYGVEPICRVLPIAPSTYYSHAAVARDPGKVNCPGFSGERKAKQMSRRLKGGNPCRRDGTPRGNRTNSARGVRLFKENRANQSSDNAAYALTAEKLGYSYFTLRGWCIQAEHDAGERPGRSSADKARIKDLEREVKALPTKKYGAYILNYTENRLL